MSVITEVVVSDTETTGFDPNEGAALLEIATVHLKDTSISGWQSFVEYDGDIPPEAKAVHHIQESSVRPGAFGCYPRSVIDQQLRNFENESMVWAFHNSAFDLQFLPVITSPVICTYRCSMHLYPDAPSHKNQVLRYYLGVEPDPGLIFGLESHRALYDSAVTAALVRHMLKSNTAEELVELTKKPVLLQKVRFGKHKGELWKNVPFGYLKWCSNQQDINEDVRHTAFHYMRRG